MYEPIVILAFPRTGSSMVAGVFREHGIFTGKCLGITPKIPTGAVENMGMKQILKSDYPLGIETIKDFKPGFRDKITSLMKAEGYIDGPWMAKHAAAYWKVWGEFSPKYVTVERDFESVMSSNTISGMSGKFGDELEDAYKVNLEAMKEVREKFGAPLVKSDDVVSGDLSSLEVAFDYCGLDFDPDKARAVIKPEHWHYKKVG